MLAFSALITGKDGRKITPLLLPPAACSRRLSWPQRRGLSCVSVFKFRSICRLGVSRRRDIFPVPWARAPQLLGCPIARFCGLPSNLALGGSHSLDAGVVEGRHRRSCQYILNILTTWQVRY